MKRNNMADVHDKETRSYNMSQIKGKNTKPEMLVRKFLFSKGFRYRLHAKNLPGKPDLILPKYKTIIFINGCFWHGHENCKYYVIPKTRTEWWIDKINRTKQRDSENFLQLSESGWKIVTIFECQLKADKLNNTLIKLLDELH
jgi:DNA mismatch endonuclease (patch repair protein)